MGTEWDFGSINPRFKVPVERFFIDIYFHDVYLQRNEQIALRNIVSRAIIAATSKYPQIGHRDISTNLFGIDPDENRGRDGESAYLSATIATPVYDLMLQVGPTQMRIFKNKSSLGDLLTALPLIEDIVREFFPPTPTDNSLVEGLAIRDRVVGFAWAFKHRLRLNRNVNNQAKTPTNIEVAKRLQKLDLPAGDQSASAPFGGIQFSKVVRADTSVIGYRDFAAGPREVAVSVECPNNVSQVDIDISSQISSGDNHAPFSYDQLFDFKTPVQDFFRDLVLDRLFDDLFASYSIEARLS